MPIQPPLSANGRFIVDAHGRRVRLAGVNWYGAQEDLGVAPGLDRTHRGKLARTIAWHGFNSVRLPFSLWMTQQTAPVADEYLAANPDLSGATPMQVYDACVEALTGAGLIVIPNCHMLDPGWCPVPETTQILTRSGWKYWHQVEGGDQTLGRASNGELQWTPILRVTSWGPQPVIRLGNAEDKSGIALAWIAFFLIVTTDGGGRRRGHRFGDALSHDKIKDAARRRMARTGESYATARRRVIAERRTDDARVADAVRMGDPALSAEEIRAAAAAHGELGPEYSNAVVASFLEKVEQEIDARVDARLGQTGQPEAPADQDSPRTLLKGIAIGIGITGFAMVAVGGNPGERLHRLVLVLLIVAVTCAVAVACGGRFSSRAWAAPRRPAAPSARAGRTAR